MSNPPLSNRQLRIGEQVKQALALLLQNDDFLLPAELKALVSISEVRMTRDLKLATCYFSVNQQVDAPALMADLNKKNKTIRTLMSRHLRHMKYMPAFRFRIDESLENYEKIEKLLRDPVVLQDLQAKTED